MESEIARLHSQIQALEAKLRSLRASRRVLMSLIMVLERDRRAHIARLETENARLHRSNSRYARTMMEANARICRLEESLQRPSPGSQGAGLSTQQDTG